MHNNIASDTQFLSKKFAELQVKLTVLDIMMDKMVFKRTIRRHFSSKRAIFRSRFLFKRSKQHREFPPSCV
jgi:hypothetical protein